METEQKEMKKEISVSSYEIRLQQFRGGKKYRWVRNDGEVVSPVFNTLEAAMAMPGKIMFLSDEEWKEYAPIENQKLKLIKKDLKKK